MLVPLLYLFNLANTDTHFLFLFRFRFHTMKREKGAIKISVACGSISSSFSRYTCCRMRWCFSCVHFFVADISWAREINVHFFVFLAKFNRKKKKNWILTISSRWFGWFRRFFFTFLLDDGVYSLKTFFNHIHTLRNMWICYLNRFVCRMRLIFFLSLSFFAQSYSNRVLSSIHLFPGY